MRRYIFIAAVIFAFSFTAFAQGNGSLCPTISITGPATSAAPGESLKFYVNISNEVEKYSVEYIWTVSSGKIISGQGGKTLEVAAGKSITVMLEVKGLPEKCPYTAYETAATSAYHVALKIDEFGAFERSHPKARMDNFFVELMGDPGSEGIIVFRSDKDLLIYVKSFRNHIAFRKFPADRLTIVISDKDIQPTEFWLVPSDLGTDKWKDDLVIKLEDFEKLQKLFQPRSVKPKTKR